MISLIMKLTTMILLGLFFVSPLLAASRRGPSTPEEMARAVELVQLLESEPWTDEATDARAWLKKFIVEIPDLTIKHCVNLFGSKQEREGIPESLLFQPTFSSLAFRLENPREGAGSTATFLAGLEGALRSYDAFEKHGSLEPVKRFEYLRELRENGQLESYVRGKGRNCR
jgi:hypothetical protein